MSPSRPLLMIPGPIEVEQDVLQEMSHQNILFTEAGFCNIFGECIEMLREVFCAPDGQPFLIAGSGSIGFDQVAANLCAAGDEVLVCSTGYFGERLAQALKIYGASVTMLEPEAGHAPSKEELETALREKQYKLVTFTHVDTSTGVLTDPKVMAETVRAVSPDTFIVVDGVCSIGGEELRMTDWDIDVVLSATQKCIGVPAGLSLVVVRDRVKEYITTHDPRVYYCSWKHWLPIMNRYEQRLPCYFATPPVQLIFALHKSLKQILDDGGIEERWKETKIVSQLVKASLKKLGCELFTASEGESAHTVTCAKYPDGVDGQKFREMAEKGGVIVNYGLHKELGPTYFRTGHMGYSARNLTHPSHLIAGIEYALKQCGCSFEKNTGLEVLKTCSHTFKSKFQERMRYQSSLKLDLEMEPEPMVGGGEFFPDAALAKRIGNSSK